MKTTPQFNLWLGTSALALIALIVGIFLWLSPPQPLLPPDQPPPPHNSLIASSSTPTATIAATDPVIPALVSPKLPPVDYPPGSVGEACEVNEFPSFDWYSNLDFDIQRSLENHLYDLMKEKLKKETCMTALERHMYSINPYLWEAPNTRNWKTQNEKNLAFSFVVIDNPMTFERIFTDPVGDFARVQEALARPECQLGKDAKSNYQLNETCHADAIHNYALVLRYCDKEHYIFPTFTTHLVINAKPTPKPTPEEDRHKWIQELEDDWLKEKCWSLDRTLNLNSELHTELSRQIQAIVPAPTHPHRIYKSVNAGLIELAARLGDGAAGLTTPPRFNAEEGYKYGPLAGWFTNLFEPAKLFTKHPPSVDRLRRLVPLFGKNIGDDGGKFIQFDHEALAQHLCAPPYDKDPDDPPSCREIINELRQEALHTPMLEAIATFEDVAMRLDVYE